MITLSISLAVLLIVAFAIIFPALRRLGRGCSADEITTEWLESFTPSTYLPMARLLDKEDFQFLSRQPGFELAVYQKLRRDRLRIFQMYLNRMISDFNRLHFAARLLVVHSSEDQSAVFTRLIWLKVRFSMAVLQTEVRLHLCRLGVGSLPAMLLIRELEAMSQTLALRNALPTAR